MRNSAFGISLLVLAACTDEREVAVILYPEPESQAAQLLIEKCSGCHLAPKPDVYPARQWPFVVQRMKLRMQTKGIGSMSEDEQGIIIDYLKRHGRQEEM